MQLRGLLENNLAADTFTQQHILEIPATGGLEMSATGLAGGYLPSDK